MDTPQLPGGTARVAGMLLAIPALGLLAATLLRSQLEADLRTAFAESSPQLWSLQTSSGTVEALCSTLYGEVAKCDGYAVLGFIQTTAVAAGVIGLTLLLAILLAGRRSLSNRKVLLRTFVPGLRVTTATLALLVILHAIIFIGVLLIAELALTNRIHGQAMFMVLLGALFGVGTLIRSAFTIIRAQPLDVLARRVRPTDAPTLYRRVADIAGRLGTAPPRNIIVGLDMNFFVTEGAVSCPGGTVTGRTLYCSLPLMRVLSCQEFEAVVGHELGHFKGQDTQFSQRFYPVYRGTASALQDLQSVGSDARGLALIPAVAMLSFFYEAFSVAERFHGREREFAADAAGAAVAGKAKMATALAKVHAYAPAWDDLSKKLAASLGRGHSVTNVSDVFAQYCARVASIDLMAGLDDQCAAHPLDTHPPLNQRLRHLGARLVDLQKPTLQVPPSDPAIQLLEGHEKHERPLSLTHQLWLARACGIKWQPQKWST